MYLRVDDAGDELLAVAPLVPMRKVPRCRKESSPRDRVSRDHREAYAAAMTSDETKEQSVMMVWVIEAADTK